MSSFILITGGNPCAHANDDQEVLGYTSARLARLGKEMSSAGKL